MHPTPAQWLLNSAGILQYPQWQIDCHRSNLSRKWINALAELQILFYELVLQKKGEISHNLYKLLLVQSSVQLLDNKGKISNVISALESSNLWICFVHDRHCIFSFCFGFHKFSFCNKPLWWEGQTGSIKFKDFCHLAFGVSLSNTRQILKHKECCQWIVWNF